MRAEQEVLVERCRPLWQAGRMYALVDATDLPEVPARARLLGEERAVSLYMGSADVELWNIAPYLFHLDGELLEWMLDTLFGEPWGIFLVSDAGLDAVRRHLRRFLIARSPEGERVYFRYYDPRVFSDFYRACNAEEQADLLGPVHAYGVAQPFTGTVLWHGRHLPELDEPKKLTLRIPIARP